MKCHSFFYVSKVSLLYNLIVIISQLALLYVVVMLNRRAYCVIVLRSVMLSDVGARRECNFMTEEVCSYVVEMCVT